MSGNGETHKQISTTADIALTSAVLVLPLSSHFRYQETPFSCLTGRLTDYHDQDLGDISCIAKLTSNYMQLCIDVSGHEKARGDCVNG